MYQLHILHLNHYPKLIKLVITNGNRLCKK